MPEVKRLTQKLKTVTFEYEGEPVTVTYNRAAITPEWERLYLEGMKAEWKSKVIIDTLASLVHSWDLTENGKPFKPTPENLQRLPLDFLAAMLTAMFEGEAPNPQSEGSFTSG